MVYFLTTFDSPRLRYVLNLVLTRILGLPYTLLPIGEYRAEQHFPALNYTSLMLKEAISLPNTGLLALDTIEEIPLRIQEGSIPYLFYYSVSATSYQIPYDLFAAVFWLVSEYEKYQAPPLDKHGRYDLRQLPSAALKLDQFPLVHLYAEHLWQVLQQHAGDRVRLERSPRQFVCQYTFDIDFPWKYRYKGLAVSGSGFGKDLLQGAWERMGERWQALVHQRDPNDTFGLIYEHFPVDQTRFFFLLDRNAPEDSRFTWRHPQYRTLIEQIVAKGYPVGIHPSYTSYLDPERLRMETEALADLVGTEVRASRQHFLRYQLPQTYRYLRQLGIWHEYTPCRFTDGGFPNGMALPYPWFDLVANEASDLLLHPAQIMDRTLQQYLGLSPEAATERVNQLLSATKAVRGTFLFLLHNDSLSESEEWKGWRRHILQWGKE